MESSAIRDAYHARPFRPFVLVLASGEKLEVYNADCMAISPSGRRVTVMGRRRGWTTAHTGDVAALHYSLMFKDQPSSESEGVWPTVIVQSVQRMEEQKAMNIHAIRDAKNAIPFRPFALTLVDGRRIEVRHQDFMSFSPNERSVFVHHPDSSYSILEPLLIVSLEYAAPATSNGPAAPPA